MKNPIGSDPIREPLKSLVTGPCLSVNCYHENSIKEIINKSVLELDSENFIRFEQKTGYPSNLHAASSKISDVHKKFMMVEKKGRALQRGLTER